MAQAEAYETQHAYELDHGYGSEDERSTQGAWNDFIL